MADSDSDNENDWQCNACLSGHCESCTDIVLIVAGLPTICMCTVEGHSGEPRDKQILDPETGTVYAPGLSITKEGKLEFHARAND